MITGVNSDVRYRGVAFHVQTEDSGRAHPHVISHLYFGGSILASERTDYADELDSKELDDHVRSIVEAQHRGMLQALGSGSYDSLLEAQLGDALGEDDRVTQPTPEVEKKARELALLGTMEAELTPLDELILEHLEGGGSRRRPSPRSVKVRTPG